MSLLPLWGSCVSPVPWVRFLLFVATRLHRWCVRLNSSCLGSPRAGLCGAHSWSHISGKDSP